MIKPWKKIAIKKFSIKNKKHALFSQFSVIMLYTQTYADVAELADALDLGSSAARREGSSPFIRIYVR